jgi:RNA polymerase sigma factor (TIGR02999 family)
MPPDQPASDGTDPIHAADIKDFMFELRMVARRLLAAERAAASVRPTSLVHSAFYRNTIRNDEWRDVTWANKEYFFADMIQGMRRSLIDRMRRSNAQKRPKLEMMAPEDMPSDFASDLEQRPERVVALDEALVWLETQQPRAAQVISNHYYLGLTTAEIAALLELSEKTVDRDLKMGRIMLAEKIQELMASD